LGPPAKFEASKLKVVLMGEEMNQYSAIIPRTYILSHCDFTADLTLTISNVINLDQVCSYDLTFLSLSSLSFLVLLSVLEKIVFVTLV
jgi:hypothetical protein